MKHILFVDDEISLLNGLKRSLRRQRKEWHMEFAENGQDALKLFQEHPFDVIVTDMRMPGMDGNQLLNEVASRYPETIRIVLSGHSDEELILRSTGSAHQFLAKPCTPEHLQSCLIRALSLRDYLGDGHLRSFVSGIQSLPSIPSVYIEIQTILKSENASLREIGEVVGNDPAMTAKILQLVNSAFFGLGRHISNTGEAAALIGIDALKSLVLSIGIFSQFDSEQIKDREFSLEALWDHCMWVATGAKRIAIQEGVDKNMVDDCFLAGQLHDIGVLIMEQNFASDCIKARSLAIDQRVPLYQAELEIFGTTHGHVGAYLLALWALADPVVEAVAFHHQPSKIQQSGFTPLAAVHVANSTDKQWMPIKDLNYNVLDRVFLERSGLINKLDSWTDVLTDIEE